MRQRRIGELDAPAHAEDGDHVCWSYDSDREHRRVLGDFCDAGLRAGQRVLYVAPEARGEPVLAGLRERGHDVEGHLAAGRLAVEATEHLYTPGGTFDPDARVDGYRRGTEEAIAAGHSRFRVAAEGATLTHLERWPLYELHADLLAAEGTFTALCAYDRRRSGPEVLAAVEAAHALSLRASRSRGDPSGGPCHPATTFRVYGTPAGGFGIAGEIDLAVGDTFRQLLGEAARVVPTPEIDLSELEFIDVAAVRDIALAAGWLGKTRGRAVLRGASPLFAEIWSVTALGRLAPTVQLEVSG